jgi:histidinol-phosphate aminotransferase
MSIRALARPEIVALQPYAHAQWLPGLTRLHANEAPWRPETDSTRAGLNRYPEPQPAALIGRLAAFYGVPAGNLLVTRGSDEAIDVLSRIFLRAGEDAILQCTPTFGMYQVAARIQGADVVSVRLERDNEYRLDPERVLAAWHPRVKLVYLCSPNNPTGNLLDPDAVETICTALEGRAVVVIDEAYIEWTRADSATARLSRHPTLAILRTLSKALALAGARVGALIGAPELIEMGRRVIPPYCLAQPTIETALAALEAPALAAARERIAGLLRERDHLRAGLTASSLVERVWPSETNFLMVDSPDADAFMAASMRGGFVVRDLRGNPLLPRSLRVTVGTRAENAALLASLVPP